MNNNSSFSRNPYYKDYHPYQPKKKKNRLWLIVLLSSCGALVILLAIVGAALLSGADSGEHLPSVSPASLTSEGSERLLIGKWQVQRDELFAPKKTNILSFSAEFGEDGSFRIERTSMEGEKTVSYKINGTWSVTDSGELHLILFKDDLANYYSDDVEEDEAVAYLFTAHPAMVMRIDGFGSNENNCRRLWYVSDSTLYLSDMILYDNNVIFTRADNE